MSTLGAKAERNESQSTAQEQLRSKGFILKNWVGKCDADKVSLGTYAVGAGEGGMYGMVFDNTFSKTVSKTATFVLLTYPSNAPPNSTHHLHNLHGSYGSSMSSALSGSLKTQASPGLRPSRASESVDSLHSQPLGRTASRTTSVSGRGEQVSPSTYHVGMLHKRRRKKGQGYARRYFSLDFVSCTLSYYYNRNSSALRGAIPLSLAAVAADERRREITIDSGAEVWHLKASNDKDFQEWTKALETASSTARGLVQGPATPAKLKVRTSGFGPAVSGGSPEEEREWEQVESLVSRTVGIRDAVRRLTTDTKASSRSSLLSPAGSPPFGQDNGDYFGAEKKSFWKRKPSSSMPKGVDRSTSSSLAVPAVTTVVTAGSPISNPKRRNKLSQEEQGIHEHCAALLNDLDSVLGEFSELIASNKQRRMAIPRSATSRRSMDTTASEMFFDAEGGEQDNSQLLMLDRHSDEDTPISDKDDFVSDTTSISSQGAESITDEKIDSGSFFPPKPKSLAPLPIDASIKRRKTVAPAKVMPPSLIAFLRKNVGKDFSTISMPVSANEPTSLLQRLAENLEYAHLLTTAASQSDATIRLLCVAAFAVSTFSNGRAKERAIRKPFNPMLGETFELVRTDEDSGISGGGYRFIAEKVSHRPVKLACQAESTTWSFAHSPVPTQKFWGKSAEIITEGRVRVALRLRSGEDEHYSWSIATTFLRNIVMGEKYVEPVGSMAVINESTGAKANIDFKTKGMFGGRSEDVQVESYTPTGSHTGYGLIGTWTQSLRLVESGKAGAEIWKAGRLVDDSANRYGFTEFAAQLNEMTSVEEHHIPVTDSRLRRDQQAAEQGELDLAEEQKKLLEEAQRERRALYEAEGKQWTPRWFAKVDGDEEVWRLKGGKEGYWEERQRGHWTGVEDVLLIGRDRHGSQGKF